MVKALFAWILSLFRWRIVGTVPCLKKFIIIVAPHTSNMDFFLGIAVREALGIKVNYLGKEALFRKPWGWIFRKLGGFPVKRGRSYNQVEETAKLIRKQDTFVLGLAPEGTRSRTRRWKTGFYWIARLSGVPVIMVCFDYRLRQVSISKPVDVTGNIEDDFRHFRSFYRKVSRVYPAL